MKDTELMRIGLNGDMFLAARMQGGVVKFYVGEPGEQTGEVDVQTSIHVDREDAAVLIQMHASKH